MSTTCRGGLSGPQVWPAPKQMIEGLPVGMVGRSGDLELMAQSPSALQRGPLVVCRTPGRLASRRVSSEALECEPDPFVLGTPVYPFELGTGGTVSLESWSFQSPVGSLSVVGLLLA